MTRDEYESQRRELLENLVVDPAIEYSVDIALVKLDKLQAEYAAAQADPLRDYYDYRNAVDGACRMIKEAEGRPVREIAANIAMIDICTQRNALLQSKERDS